jgi:hypothetical protein
MNLDVHSVNTRHKHCLHKPFTNFSCFQKSIYYAGITIFNNIPSDLKCLLNEEVRFKVALKQYLNTHSFYSFDEYLLSRKQLMYLWIALCVATVYSWVL